MIGFIIKAGVPEIDGYDFEEVHFEELNPSFDYEKLFDKIMQRLEKVSGKSGNEDKPSRKEGATEKIDEAVLNYLRRKPSVDKSDESITPHKSVDEFYVKTLEIGGLGSALTALRLPSGKDARSKAKSSWNVIKEKDTDWMYYGTQIEGVSPKDMILLSSLVKNGDEHAKVLRGAMVWCEINAPRYMHQEIDTYRVGCERLSSESTMHIQGQGLNEDALVAMKEGLTEGTMQKRVWMFSYQTLRRIYFQRRNHRLPQWRMFCKWIETLPYASQLITI